MPALTHGRVKNGFNGYASRVKLPNGSVSNTQPLNLNGGAPPKRNFEAKYNAQINAPNALTSFIGNSFATKRANARRAGNPKRGLLGLPVVSWTAPGQASKRRKVPLVYAKGKPDYGCYCPGGNPSPPLIGTSFEGNIQEYATDQLGLILDNCNPGWLTYIAGTGAPWNTGENLNPSCVPSGMTNHFTYDAASRIINFYIFGTDHLPAGQFPLAGNTAREVKISVDKLDGTGPKLITTTSVPNPQLMFNTANVAYQGRAQVVLVPVPAATPPSAGFWSFGTGDPADDVLTAGMKVKIEFS